MRIRLNGLYKELPDGVTIDALLTLCNIERAGIAVEVNREICPKRLHAVTALADGDNVEIVRMMGGG
ncbi:MAG: thiamine biosynthesis protein ThiS [Deltaproteobacteria bacterium RIFCSPLOWO2_02_FULL_53_8]|nr:MAG: thiamine biosynthesis protein ThiS [Deltaproteobacteria bacterium RIFCSPLOWO2_02_FULL_53_8]